MCLSVINIMNVGVVIVCAGKGKRLGKIDKAVLPVAGKPLFYRAVNIFKEVKQVKEIALVLRKKHFSLAKKIIKDKRVKFIEGGRIRQDSVCRGLWALSDEVDYVLVHDGARPFAEQKLITRVLRELKTNDAVICALAPRDTLKFVEDGCVQETLPRNKIVCVQTPQGFKKQLLLDAYEKLGEREVFDDAQAVEYLGKKVKVIEGSRLNIKVTYPEDVALAQAIIKSVGWSERQSIKRL